MNSLRLLDVMFSSRTWPLRPSGLDCWSLILRVRPAALPMMRSIEVCAVKHRVIPRLRISPGLTEFPSAVTLIQVVSFASISIARASFVAGGAGSGSGVVATEVVSGAVVGGGGSRAGWEIGAGGPLAVCAGFPGSLVIAESETIT